MKSDAWHPRRKSARGGLLSYTGSSNNGKVAPFGPLSGKYSHNCRTASAMFVHRGRIAGRATLLFTNLKIAEGFEGTVDFLRQAHKSDSMLLLRAHATPA
jgi:hypothetical protein